jgi:hypothetical protein
MNLSLMKRYFVVSLLAISILAYDQVYMQQNRHHNTNRHKKMIEKNNNNKLKLDPSVKYMMNPQSREPIETFREYIKWLNERAIDDLYFCSSIYNSKNDTNQLWILRNKKCLNLTDTRLNFYQAYELCKSQPYSYHYLISRREVEQLNLKRNSHKFGMDIFNTYFKLLLAENYKNKVKGKIQNAKVSLWLNDDYFQSQECELSDFAPVVHFDEKDCKNGCFDCVPRNSTPGFYSICAKSCSWKVPYNSFCNTMEINEFQLNKNLYFQRDQLVYVCQGNLTCNDYNCECPKEQNLYSKYYCK